ncbi:hypothetical protein DPMN_098389, partial [Dreissena polymorpha]
MTDEKVVDQLGGKELVGHKHSERLSNWMLWQKTMVIWHQALKHRGTQEELHLVVYLDSGTHTMGHFGSSDSGTFGLWNTKTAVVRLDNSNSGTLRQWNTLTTLRQQGVGVSIVVCQINILTKFHKDWMKTINILTKLHQDWMQTVTSTVYTNKLLTDGRTDTRRQAQRTADITRSHKLTVSLHD